MKGDKINPNLDDLAADYNQGEAALRNYIAGNSYYSTLPEFYEGEPT
jgi:hypothetical protein